MGDSRDNPPLDEQWRQVDTYLSQAEKLQKQGRYGEAATVLEKSVEAEQASPKPRLTKAAEEFQTAGDCYYQICKYSKALTCYERTLVLARQLGQDADIARVLRSIGRVYHSWGQYAKALEYYEQALALNRQLGQDANIATILNNIGRVYHTWGQYANALDYFEQALAFARKLRRDADIARGFNNIGLVYYSWGQYANALECYEQALALNRQLSRDAAIASDFNHIGGVYEAQAQYARALEYYEHALALARQLGRDSLIAKSLDNIGGVYYALKQYPEAITHFIESVDIKEKLRKTATGDARRDYLASQIVTYQFLTSCYVRIGGVPGAFETTELSRARRLTEQLAGSDADVNIPLITHLQNTTPEDTTVLVYANTTLPDIVTLIITKEHLTVVELPKSEFVRKVMGSYHQEIEKALAKVRKIKQGKLIKKDDDEIIGVYEEDLRDFEKIIKYYRLLLTNLSTPDTTKTFGSILFDFLIGSVLEHIEGKTRLLIVPDGMLNFLPFETLVDDQGRYLAENYTICYAQSLGVLELIEQRNYAHDEGRFPLLAFGGAVYNPRTYQAEMIENKAQLTYLQNRANRAISQDISLQDLYTSLGYGTWKNLPGTFREVKAIKQAVNGADILTGDVVTKSTIKELSNDGLLAKYKVLHFATHGVTVPEIPELSALVLSQLPGNAGVSPACTASVSLALSKEAGGTPALPGEDDGYLRIDEIVELDLKADFVNLSACETGLGKVYKGEGVVGLTQAFLLAGANSLSVSLWQVADASTTAFMVALYKLVAEEGLSYADAIAEVKRRFIKGEFGELWRAPRYWAPFVFYGKR